MNYEERQAAKAAGYAMIGKMAGSELEERIKAEIETMSLGEIVKKSKHQFQIAKVERQMEDLVHRYAPRMSMLEKDECAAFVVNKILKRLAFDNMLRDALMEQRTAPEPTNG